MYRALRCFLREFYADPAGKVQDEPLLEAGSPGAQLLEEKVFLDYGGGVGMPWCTRLAGASTRVCHVRVNKAWHFTDQYLPQLHLLGVRRTDFFMYNAGLWHHKVLHTHACAWGCVHASGRDVCGCAVGTCPYTRTRTVPTPPAHHSFPLGHRSTARTAVRSPT